jgi:hypothetical protein
MSAEEVKLKEEEEEEPDLVDKMLFDDDGDSSIIDYGNF